MKRLFLVLFLVLFSANAFAITKAKFDFVVGVDGNFKQAMDAAKNANPTLQKRFYIFFPNGEYNIGSLTGDANQKTTFTTSNVSFIGQNTDSTVIYNKSSEEGISITATLYFYKTDNMYLQDLTIYNKANYGNTSSYSKTGRHVAVQEQGNKFIYKNVKLLSTQDTYYTKGTRTYWETGEIHGTTDYICGGGDVFFNQCRLYNLKKSAMTAPSTTSDWGYVFHSCTIDGNVTGYTLGRSWNNAKAVFINTTMNILPDEKGWGEPMNSVPQVFAEYGSKNNSGSLIDLSKRRTTYTKGDVTVNLNPILTASQAAQYNVENVLSGTDQWKPNLLTKQVSAPKLTFEGNRITWQDNDSALCWVVLKNGKYYTNVTTPSIETTSFTSGDKIIVRAANSMGGLGAASLAVTVEQDSRPYYKINLSPSLGGSISQNPEGTSLPEGTSVTFTAAPLLGWQLDHWAGVHSGTENSWTHNSLTQDISLEAFFMPIDKNKYEAESGVYEKGAIFENKNTGYSGDGYVNFSAENGSSVDILIYSDNNTDAEIHLVYANGSTTTRTLSVLLNNSIVLATLDFEPTADWTTWGNKTISLSLPQGLSTISLQTVNENDGPNIDALTIEPKTTAVANSKNKPSFYSYDSKSKVLFINSDTIQSISVELFSLDGKRLFSQQNKKSISLQSLNQGVYIMKILDGQNSFYGLVSL